LRSSWGWHEARDRQDFGADTVTDRSHLAARLDDLKVASVLCVGDAMLDRYVEGEVERISPEAPVPVLRVTRRAAMPGGAGNVARNIAALGAAARVVAVVGRDDAGQELAALIEAQDGVTADLAVIDGRPTAVKTRHLAAGQQLLRTDEESTAPLAGGAEASFLERAIAGLSKAAAVVLSDYGKGALTDRVLAEIVAAANAAAKPVLVDPKGGDYGRYRGATLVTPNRKELAEAAHMPTDGDEAIVAAAHRLVEDCGLGAVLATRGAAGMTLVTADGTVTHLPAEAREVFDVSGAGDTVIAAVAAGLAVGLPLADAASLANVAGGIVVGKTGTAVAHAGEVAAALHRQDLMAGEPKLVSPEQLVERVAAWRRRGLTVGFTNGCFDLLHPGHVSLLTQARAACDRLVVGLNSDASARRLKGDSRPVQSEAARAAVLGSLASVDLVVLFGEDTPIRLIEEIRPDVLVKGADYAIDQVVGADVVQANGGRVLLADLTPGYSTTATIAKMAE